MKEFASDDYHWLGGTPFRDQHGPNLVAKKILGAAYELPQAFFSDKKINRFGRYLADTTIIQNN